MKIRNKRYLVTCLFALLLWTVTCSMDVITVSADTKETQAEESKEGQGGSDDYSIESARDCVVLIQSFFSDQAGNSYRLHTGSGFVVSKSSSQTYIVTSNQNLPKDSDITKYCEKNGLTIDRDNISTSISVVISGDVKAKAELNDNMHSEQKNFCILTTSLLENKEVARLDDTKNLSIGDSIWSLGYDLHDDEQGVGLVNGVIQNSNSIKNGIAYIQTTARTVPHSAGGPLVNEEGYVIGMQDATLNVNGDETYYSLPIGEITEILNNYNLRWESKSEKEILKSIEGQIEEAQELINSGTYTSDSTEKLSKAVEEARALLEQDSPEYEKLLEVQKNLIESRGQLQEKTPKIRVITRIVMPIVLVILLLVLIRNLVIFFRLKKERNSIQMVSIPSMSEKRETNSVPSIRYTPAVEKKPNSSSGGEDFVDDDMTITMYGKEAYLVFANGRRVKLDSKSHKFKIGRRREVCDIIIDNQYVSREHAIIMQISNHHYLIRISPDNITEVNGRSVQEKDRRLLKNNDRITLGTEEIRYEIIKR